MPQITSNKADLDLVDKLGETGLTSQQVADAIVKSNSVQSSASEIDGNYSQLLLKIKESTRICYCGDSISAGTGVNNKENVSTYNIKEYIRSINKIDNIGFQTASPKFNHYHTIKVNTVGSWVENYNNNNSINGFSFDTSVVGEFLTAFVPMQSQNKAQIYFTVPNVDSVVEVYINDVLAETINFIVADVNKIKLSSVLTLGATTNKIKIVLVSGKLAVSGINYSKDSSTKFMDLYVTGGRRIAYINNEILSYYNNYDVLFFALSYNDVVGGTVDKEPVYTILTSLANYYKTNNKTFVYINFVWELKDSENWVLTKINELFAGYENYFYIDYKATIKDYTNSLANETYRKDVLKEWADSAHPNDSGHLRYIKYFFYKVFAKKDFNIIGKDLVYENYSTYNPKNLQGINPYGCNFFGVNNKTQDDAKFVSLIGVGNETTQNEVYALGQYNVFSFNNAFALGKNNNITKAYSTVLGAYANALNQGLTVGFSNSSSFFRQTNKHVRSGVTTNTTELLLKDVNNNSFLYTNANTKTIVKGFIYCFDLVANTYSEFKVDCVINNNGTVATRLEGNGTTNGVMAVSNPIGISCSVIGSTSNNNAYTVRVTGNTTKLNWVANLETVEISVS